MKKITLIADIEVKGKTKPEIKKEVEDLLKGTKAKKVKIIHR